MKSLAVVTAVCAIAVAQKSATGWPQYLGPHRNGTTMELMVPAAPTLAIAWRNPAGAAMSAITVTGGRAYTLESDGQDDYLLALDAATGKHAWRVKLGATHPESLNGPGSTPAIAGDLVIAFGSSCRLAAYSARDGKPAWDVDFAHVYKTRFAGRQSCFISPLVHDGLVVLPTGSLQTDRLVALDAATGKQRWSAGGVEASLNTNPSLWTAKGGAQLLYHYFKPPGTSGLAAVNLADGTTAWTVDAESGISNTAPMPLGNGRVLMQMWQGSFVVDASDGRTPKRLWSNASLIALPVPAVVVDGHIYGFGGNSGEYLTCMDAASGAIKWTERTYRGAMAVSGRTLVMQGEGSGLLRLIAAEPAKYRELARLEVLKPGATTVTPPSIAESRIYVRNLEEIVAVTVR